MGIISTSLTKGFAVQAALYKRVSAVQNLDEILDYDEREPHVYE